jgi:outer membrane autotransporter protein
VDPGKGCASQHPRFSQRRLDTWARRKARAAVSCAFSARLVLWAVALAITTTLGPGAGQAQNATWLVNPTVAGAVAGTFDYKANANWSTAVPQDTAFFGTTNGPNISLSFDKPPFFPPGTTIGGWTFNGTSNYTFYPGFLQTSGLTFTGAGITINSGTVTIINTGPGGSESVGTLNFTNNSTAGSAIIFNNATESAAPMSGFHFKDNSTAGSATITNNGLLDFSDNSTAGSATIINNAPGPDPNFEGLNFQDNSTAGRATITNNGAVVFTNTSAAGQAQLINNAGGIVDFSATTALPGKLLTAGSIAGAGEYFLGGTELTVGGNNLSTEVSGVISDCGPTGTDCVKRGATGGSLVKTGTGTLTLSGNNTYSGSTTVNQGTLVANGSIISAVTVNNGATLSGTGTVGSTTVANGGVLAPGNSIGFIGTMTVIGNLTLDPGAVYEVEVNAQGQSDKVSVLDNANLTGATLRVLASKGKYKPNTEYEIIDTGTGPVIGTFAKVTTNLAFLTPSVNYAGGDGNDVVLTLKRTRAFASVAQTRNHRAVAGALDQSPTSHPLFLGVLNQTVGGALQAFDALSGELHATVAGMLADDSRYVREAILGRLMQASYTKSNGQVASLGAAGPQMASLNGQAMALGYDDKSLAPSPSAPGLTFWTRAFGAWASFDGDNNAASANRNLGGFVSGIDARVTGSWRFGLAAGYSQSNLDVDKRYSSADVNSFHLGGYGGGMAGPLALRGGGTWTWNNIDTSRAVAFPGFYERDKASYNPATGQLFGEVAYPTAMWGLGLEPFAGLAYVSINGDNFHERGGNLAALTSHGTDENVGYSTVGLRAAQTMHWGGMLVTPHVSGAWQHAFDDVTPDAALTFASTGIGFTVNGVPLAQDTALVDAGFDLALAPNATAGVSYSGQFGDRVQDNAVKGRFTWLF